jgi:hypothetical protein
MERKMGNSNQSKTYQQKQTEMMMFETANPANRL